MAAKKSSKTPVFAALQMPEPAVKTAPKSKGQPKPLKSRKAFKEPKRVPEAKTKLASVRCLHGIYTQALPTPYTGISLRSLHAGLDAKLQQAIKLYGETHPLTVALKGAFLGLGEMNDHVELVEHLLGYAAEIEEKMPK